MFRINFHSRFCTNAAMPVQRWMTREDRYNREWCGFLSVHNIHILILLNHYYREVISRIFIIITCDLRIIVHVYGHRYFAYRNKRCLRRHYLSTYYYLFSTTCSSPWLIKHNYYKTVQIFEKLEKFTLFIM